MGPAAAPPLVSAADDVARRMRGVLDSAGFSYEGVTEALAVEDVRALDRLPWQVAVRRLGDAPLDALIRVFLLGADVAAPAAKSVLAPMSVEEWAAAGLLEVREGAARARARLVPDQDGLVLASDWPGSPERPLRPDHVLGDNPTAALLANVTVRPHLGAALDLGTGCGVQALRASRHVERVAATDLNPRAVAFARFNAALNDVEVECIQGNLFEPVAGRRFDLIVSNPPFVISPESSLLFRDSELGGEGIARRLISTAPGFLAERGFCQLLCNWAHVEGIDWEERLGGYLEGSGCNAWVIELDRVDPDIYASGWIRHSERDPERFRRVLDEWMSHYEREGITAISWTAVTMRRTSSSRPWFRVDEVADKIEGPCGDHVLRCFAARELLAATDDDALLGMPLRVAPEARLEQQFAPAPDGWAGVEGRLTIAAGLPFVGAVDSHVANLLVRCDGTSPLRDALARSAADAGVSLESLTSGGMPVIRRLIENGFLVVVEDQGGTGRGASPPIS